MQVSLQQAEGEDHTMPVGQITDARSGVSVMLHESLARHGHMAVQIDTNPPAELTITLNDGELFRGDPDDKGNTFEVIRQAALRYLHGTDGTGTPPLAEELAALADALGVPRQEVEAIVEHDAQAARRAGAASARDLLQASRRASQMVGLEFTNESFYSDVADHRRSGFWLISATADHKAGFDEEVTVIMDELRKAGL